MVKKTMFLAVVLLLTANVVLATRIVPLDLYKPFRIRCDGERIFIGQEAVIYVYSANDYKLITKFGKPGEGPQEFKLLPEFSPDFDVQSDTLVAFSIGKVSLFSKEGKFIDEKKIFKGGGFQFYRKMGDQFLGEIYLRGKDNNILNKAVVIFDANLKQIKEVFRYLHNFQFAKKYNPIDRGLYIPNFYIYDNKIFIGGNIDEGTIHVFDTKGSPLYTLQPPLEKIKFTEADKKGHIDSFAHYREQYERVKNRFDYPDYFPLFQNFIVADNCIYIQTYKRNKEDTGNEVVIISLKGELLKRVWLPFDEYFDFTPCPYMIRDKKLYQCVDNEEEGIWELHITKIE